MEDLLIRVEEVLERQVRPIVRQDGGDIRVLEMREHGTLVILYMGMCSGCPAIEWTHSRIVQPAVTGALKEIRKVEWRFDCGI